MKPYLQYIVADSKLVNWYYWIEPILGTLQKPQNGSIDLRQTNMTQWN